MAKTHVTMTVNGAEVGLPASKVSVVGVSAGPVML